MPTINQPQRLSKFIWDGGFSGSGTLYVYYESQLRKTSTNSGSVRIRTNDDEEPPVIEVVEDPTIAEQRLYIGYVILQWSVVSGVKSYIIEELVGSTWAERFRSANEGARYIAYQTRFLDDSTTYSFRLKVVDQFGRTKTGETISVFVVRNPDPPGISLSYSSGTNELTISES